MYLALWFLAGGIVGCFLIWWMDRKISNKYWICDWCGGVMSEDDQQYHISGTPDRFCEECAGASGKIIL